SSISSTNSRLRNRLETSTASNLVWRRPRARYDMAEPLPHRSQPAKGAAGVDGTSKEPRSVGRALRRSDGRADAATSDRHRAALRRPARGCGASDGAATASSPPTTDLEGRSRSEIFEQIFDVAHRQAVVVVGPVRIPHPGVIAQILQV